MRLAWVTPTVMPRSLKEPVGLCPSCLSQRSSARPTPRWRLGAAAECCPRDASRRRPPRWAAPARGSARRPRGSRPPARTAAPRTAGGAMRRLRAGGSCRSSSRPPQSQRVRGSSSLDAGTAAGADLDRRHQAPGSILAPVMLISVTRIAHCDPFRLDTPPSSPRRSSRPRPRRRRTRTRVGPLPEIEQPSAPASSAARLAALNPGSSGARAGSAMRSSSARRSRAWSPVAKASTIAATWAAWIDGRSRGHVAREHSSSLDRAEALARMGDNHAQARRNGQPEVVVAPGHRG